MPTLLARTLSDRTLLAAWQRVQVNAGCPGTDGIGIEQFNIDAELRIRRLRKQVVQGRYMPQPLRRIALPRAGRGPRLLAVPSVRDRILQTAVGIALGPALDATFGDSSFAYRPGRSVIHAVEHVIRGRQLGFAWAVDADIHAFFDQVPHSQLLERLRSRIADHSLLPLLGQWLANPVIVDGLPQRQDFGIAQGSPLSPLLANLYLDPFDRAIATREQWLVRYADDFLILCRSYDAAEQALEQAAQWLGEHGLEINWDKTRIRSFDHGFEFLGVRFHHNRVAACDPAVEAWLLPRRLRNGAGQPAATAINPASPEPAPALLAAVRAPESVAQANADGEHDHDKEFPFEEDFPIAAARSPLLRTLHLCEHGNYLHRRGGRLVVGHRDEIRLEVPLNSIDQVHADAEGSISFGALRAMLEHRIGFVVDGANGSMGWLAGSELGHVELQRAQFRRLDEAGFRLDTARALVHGKIANSRVLLRRYLRLRAERDTGAVDQLASLQRGLAGAASVEAVRGFEGQAAKVYFDALAALLAPAWRFEARTRRPPRDPVNALLSYGYAVLFHNTLTLIVRRGLHPCLGMLHGLRDGHAALASDLVEEFRPLVVDAVVLRMLLRGDFSAGDFENGGAELPCRLVDGARRRYIQALEAKLDHPLTHPDTGKAMDLRRAIETQVALYADVVSGRMPTYRAFIQR